MSVLFKKKFERKKSLSRREISLARLENFRKEVITDTHSVALSKFLRLIFFICLIKAHLLRKHDPHHRHEK